MVLGGTAELDVWWGDWLHMSETCYEDRSFVDSCRYWKEMGE